MVLVAVVVGVLTWSLKPDPPLQPPPIRRISMDLGVEGNLRLRLGTAARLSPDGSTLAYLYAPEDGLRGSKLFLRRLDQLEPTELTAAKNASMFCFSPDGRWIAFKTGGGSTLQNVFVSGGGACPNLS